MKNLYEKLSEENKLKIQEASKQFPASISLLKDVLQNSHTWSKMEISDAMSLFFTLENSKPFDLNMFIDFFKYDKNE